MKEFSPDLGASIPRRSSPLLSRPCGWLLKSFGWTIAGQFPDQPKFVAIVAPHTSNWDWFIGMGVIKALELDVHWLGKHTIFAPIVGGMLKKLGGIPVNRSAPGGVVQQAADLMNQRSSMILALAPEGTRKKVTRFKTGFYHIARLSGVPILPLTLDYDRRVLTIGDVFWPTEDADADMAALQELYRRWLAIAAAESEPDD